VTFHRDAVARGAADEWEVATALRERGWGVERFGQGVWSDPMLLEALRATETPLRHAPDLLAGRPDPRPGYGRCFVEVVNCPTPEHTDRSMELAKLVGLMEWGHLAPVWVVDVADWKTWPVTHMWPGTAVSPVTRQGNGSRDPYAWFSRAHDLDFVEVFR
jgi:hypothetical protein